MIRQLSVVLLSGKPENLRRCLKSIQETHPGFDFKRVVAVADGYDPSPELKSLGLEAIPLIKPVTVPFNASRNLNAGIEVAQLRSRDVLILADDAEITTYGGIDYIANDLDKAGIVSARINGMGARCQQATPDALSFKPLVVTSNQDSPWFVCCAIAGEVFEKIGLFDEELDGYGMEDADFCLRAVEAGIKIGVSSALTARHRTMSVHRAGGKKFVEEVTRGRDRLLKKWEGKLPLQVQA